MIKNPTPTPKQNLMELLKPFWFAKIIAIILFGPGVNEATKTKSKNESTGIKFSPLLCYNVQNGLYNVLYFKVYNMDVITHNKKLGVFLNGRAKFNHCKKFEKS